MTARRMTTAIGSLALTCYLIGCGVLPFFDSVASNQTNFLGMKVSNFGGARAIPVQDDATTSESTAVSLPQDLLATAPVEVSMVVSAPDVRIVVDEEPGMLNPASADVERHLAVTFSVALSGEDACASDELIGPFGVTIVNGVATLASESLPLEEAVQAIVRSGRFELCALTIADFDGALSVAKFSLEFGKPLPKEDRVDLCHIPPDNPEEQHSITVGAAAVDAHLAHGDYLGECETGGLPDADGDGVADDADNCPYTPSGEDADALGCSCSQWDGDNDGVNDCDDLCPNTVDAPEVDLTGCPIIPPDVDSDGIFDATDLCPETAAGETVDAHGCSCSQLDDDSDGVTDCDDLCADTPAGETTDPTGCSCSQLDEDADGVDNCDDFCPGTPPQTPVDLFGCEVLAANAGSDVSLEEVGCVTLEALASGGTAPYLFSWSAPGWEGSMEQSPAVVPAETTTYTLTVTDFSFPPVTATDMVTVTINSHEGLQYSIVDLGSLSANASYPAGINDAGDVVGYYYTDAWKKRAFLYSSGTMTELAGTLGGDESDATDINNAGQVVGQAKTESGEWHAFLWDSANGMQDLGTLGGTSSVASAISESGVVVGSSGTGSTTHAFVYSGGVMRDAGTLEFSYSEATGINDLGTAVGTLLAHGANPDALIYEDGVLRDLSSPLFSANRAWAVNGAGMIIGHSWGGIEYGSFLNVCDTSVNLGVLAGFPKTSAWGVNDAGQIVGSASTDTSTLFNAFLYTGGTLHNLNDLLVSGDDWEYLTAAFAINSSGQITGYGRINRQFHGFLLTPVP